MSRDPRSDGLRAAAGLAVAEAIAAALPGARSPVGGAVRANIDRTPAWLSDVAIAALDTADKPAAVTGLALQGIGASLLLSGHAATRSAAAVVPLGLAVAAASRPDAATGPTVAAGLAGALTIGRLQRDEARSTPARTLGVAAVAAALLRARRRARARSAADAVVVPEPPAWEEPAVPLAGMAPFITPVEDFYAVDVSVPRPQVDAMRWRLRVDGLVDRPLSLTFDELLALGVEHRVATLCCVHNRVGGRRIGTATWSGVPIERLLELAGVKAGGAQVVSHSVDGFHAGFPVELLERGHRGLVVVGMNGRPLTAAHGHPARIFVPGLHGYDAQTKWVDRLEVTDSSTRDYWGARGWPTEPALVPPGSRIDVPADRSRVPAGALDLGGYAWHPLHGVAGVEVRVDDGEWRPVQLGPRIDDDAWRWWTTTVDLDAGSHRIAVRAIGQPDGSGTGAFFPTGLHAAHTVQVLAEAGRTATRGPHVWRRAASEAADRRTLTIAGLRAWHAPEEHA